MDDVDIVLYDSFAQPEADHDEIEVLVAQPPRPAGRRVHVELPSRSSSTAPSPRGPAATCRRRCRRTSWSPRSRPSTPASRWSAPPPTRLRTGAGPRLAGTIGGPHRRESEILALITQGKSNAEVAATMFLSIELRQVLHPLDVSQDRGDQPHAGSAVGHRARVPTRPSPHRPLARRALTGRGRSATCSRRAAADDERGHVEPRRHEQRTAREGACRKRPKRADHDSFAEPITARTDGARSRGMGAAAAMTEHAVVIAGGGPTGLMLAGELALAGIDVVIVERRASQDRRRIASRGSSLPHHRGARSAWHRGTLPLGGPGASVRGLRRDLPGHQRLPHPPQLPPCALAEPDRAHPGRLGR